MNGRARVASLGGAATLLAAGCTPDRPIAPDLFVLTSASNTVQAILESQLTSESIADTARFRLVEFTGFRDSLGFWLASYAARESTVGTVYSDGTAVFGHGTHGWNLTELRAGALVMAGESPAVVHIRPMSDLEVFGVVFHIDTVMTVGRSYPATLHVGDTITAEILEATLGRPNVVDATVPAAPFVKATFRPNSRFFSTVTSDPASRRMVPGEEQQWDWDVAPLDSGRHTLTLTVATYDTFPDLPNPPRAFGSFRQNVTVLVSPKTFSRKAWDWLNAPLPVAILTVLLAAAVGAAGWYFRGRWERRKKPDKVDRRDVDVPTASTATTEATPPNKELDREDNGSRPDDAQTGI